MIEQALDDPGESLGAVIVAQFGVAARADRRRRHLGPEVAQGFLGHADVGGNHLEDLLDQHALAVELHGRDDQPFLVDVARVGRHAARRAPADVDLMAQRAGERDIPPAVEHRPEDHDVRMMGTTDVGMVEDHHIARRQGEIRRHVARRIGQRALVRGHVIGLGDEPAGRVEQRRGAIHLLAQHHGIGRAHERRAHLADTGNEEASDHLEGDGIVGHRHAVDHAMSIRHGRSSRRRNRCRRSCFRNRRR